MMKSAKTTQHFKKQTDNSRLPNYMALIFIAPPVLSIMAYEFLDYIIYLIHPWRNDYQPVNGLGMLLPMVFMMETFSVIFSYILLKKVGKITDFIHKMSVGDFSSRIPLKHMAPFSEVAENLNQMAEELESVETLRKDFINDFSHEFKTPIVSINGFANLLLDTEVTPEEEKEYLKIIAEESERLSHMAKQTMLLSSLDSQTRVLNKQGYSLDEQIRQNIILLSHDWSEKEIEMDIHLDSVTIFNDPALLTHIWVNLLNNAIKFTPQGGTISVSLSKVSDGRSSDTKSFSARSSDDKSSDAGTSGDRIRVQISDTGKGMTKEECRRIFNRYYQTDESHSTKGLGLGLSIVKRVVELCQGSVEVTSTPGEGSCFTVELPVS